MIDTSELDLFAEKLSRAAAELKPFAAEVLQDEGEDFLNIVQDAIMSAGNVDTRLLLSSFTKGSGNCVWKLDIGALTLEISTNVEYAKWVNDGHKQQPGRFIPGTFNGNGVFRYVPGARSGMVLKASHVAGSHFFDKAVEAFTGYWGETVQAAFEVWFAKYF